MSYGEKKNFFEIKINFIYENKLFIVIVIVFVVLWTIVHHEEIGPGIHGTCRLNENIEQPSATLVESMHLVYEGICKVLNRYIFKVKKYPCYLGKE
jgi:hypothetical protein